MKQENISVFDIFKIGIGPSSSHTLGPWRAAQRFLQHFENLQEISAVKILLYGSLAKTGKGHGTDIAVILGLAGADPVTFDTRLITQTIAEIQQQRALSLGGERVIPFSTEGDIRFLMTESLPFHPNGLTFCALMTDGTETTSTYYSIGGGFVVEEGEQDSVDPPERLPFPIARAEELLHWCRTTGLSIAEIVLENETFWRSTDETERRLLNIAEVMKKCIFRGCHETGILPGGLHVRRRAALLNKKLTQGNSYENFSGWVEVIRQGGERFPYILDWVSCFALAVNEENASFSRVVTAPTNGAAGVIPAVLLYYMVFCEGNSDEQILKFLLTAAEIGSIFKKGATISAAMGGCQAEIGVSSAMAAAALTESLGGNPRQALMAAEIAMEHHLGLTCDPVGGLVQIPCIERNTMGAIKAITAAQLALKSNPDDARVSLDAVVKTMWQTAQDMNQKYKETSEGGLAVNIPLGLSEC